MKLKVCLLLSLLFSIISISAFPLIDRSCNDFSLIEKLVKDTSCFVESGVKVEYESDLSADKTINSILKKVKQNYSDESIYIANNEISLKNDISEIKINVYDRGDKTLVEAIITNFTKEKKILNLIQELSQLQVNTSNRPRYFKYVKGKINNTEEGLYIVEETKRIKDIDTLDIHDGYVGTGKLQDGERVNFAVSNYDKGTYLVIGTPIIFSTY